MACWWSTGRARSGAVATLQDDLLLGGRDVHVETLFGDRLESRPARCSPNYAFEPNTLRLQRISPLTELSNFGLLAYAERSPCYDARSHQDETNQQDGDRRPATGGYSALRHARSRALRARGLAAVSSSDAVRARRVIVVPSGRPRQVHTGCFGGQMQAALHSRKVFFTIRSSPEW
jgi:hypothetical protein